MSRERAVIVVSAPQDRTLTSLCLTALRPTLGVRDEVLLLAPDYSPEERQQLRQRFPWVRFTGPDGLPALATCPYVVFLSGRTVPTGRWIDPLILALTEQGVAAAGPRSNHAVGAQSVLQAEYPDARSLRKFARQWCSEHSGQRSRTNYLDGFCLALRGSVLGHLGATNEGEPDGTWFTDDLCKRLRQQGHRLVICHDSFVHNDTGGHPGGRRGPEVGDESADSFSSGGTRSDSPLVSACLITKDEEQNIGACLSSLRGFADEIVIYDTGSADATVDIARSYGARVIVGYWDDDFARARNEALSHCRGEWIAWLDADETLDADPTELRALLTRTKPEYLAWMVPIHNLTDQFNAESAIIHFAMRLFRREPCEWAGRLHEQVVTKAGSDPTQAQLEIGRILHTGYLPEMLAERSKADRNIRVSQAEVDSTEGPIKAYALTSLGRSLSMAGRYEEAIRALEESLSYTESIFVRQLAISNIVHCLRDLGRLEDALDWLERLEKEHPPTVLIRTVKASVKLALGEWQEVVDLLDGVDPHSADMPTFGYRPGTIAAQKAHALAELGRFSDASELLTSSLSFEGTLDVHFAKLVGYATKAGQPLGPIARAIPGEKATAFLAQLMQMSDVEQADAMLESCFLEGNPSRMTVLAAASRLATRASIDRALIWSSRLRDAGYGGECPLIAIANGDQPVAVRARAAAIAAGAFSDQRGFDAFAAVLARADGQDRTTILQEAAQICPSALPQPELLKQ